jgi:hypothetical protein
MPLTQVNADVVGNLAFLESSGNISTTAFFIGDGSLLTNLANVGLTTVGNLAGLEVDGTIKTTGIIYANAGIPATNTTTGAVQITGTGGLGVNGNVVTTSIYTDNYFYSNGVRYQGFTSQLPITFETLSKNLPAYPYSVNYVSGAISNVVYTIPSSGTVTKAFTYALSGLITGISLAGPGLGTAIYTKNLSYTGTSLSGATYSIL